MSWGAGIAIGMGVGVAMGSALDNMGVGLAIGVAIGIVFAIAIGSVGRGKRRIDEDDDAENNTDDPGADAGDSGSAR